MRAYLRLISLLLLFQLPCQAQEETVLTDSVGVDTVVTDTAEIRQYNLLLEAGPHQISGICLDKWYIRKVLQADMSFFFSNLPKQKNVRKISRLMTFSPDGEIHMTNIRFKIKYTFTPIIEE